MPDLPHKVTLQHMPVVTPFDAVTIVSKYAAVLPRPIEIPRDVYTADVMRSLLTSPTTRKEIGLYSMLLPAPVWVLHKDTPMYAPHLTAVSHTEQYPEGKYHGVLYVQMSNVNTRMDHYGKITTPIGKEDTIEIGVKEIVLVTPYEAQPTHKRFLRRLMDAVEEQMRIFNEM